MRTLQKHSLKNVAEAARASTPLKNSAFSQSKKCSSFNNLVSKNISGMSKLSTFSSASRMSEVSSLENSHHYSPFVKKENDLNKKNEKSKFYDQTSFMLKEDASAYKDSEDLSVDSADGSDQFANPLLRKPKNMMSREQFHEYYVSKHGQPQRLGD